MVHMCPSVYVSRAHQLELLFFIKCKYSKFDSFLIFCDILFPIHSWLYLHYLAGALINLLACLRYNDKK